MGAAHTPCRGPYRDILEPCAHILYRHQLRRNGSYAQAVVLRCRVAAARYVPHDVRYVSLSGASAPRTVSTLRRAHALHTLHGVYRSGDEPHLPSYAAMGQPLVPVRRSIESGSLSHTYPLRAGVCAALSSGLLAHLPRHRSHNAAHSMALAATHRAGDGTVIDTHSNAYRQ